MTVTLPEDVLLRLSAVDADLGRATCSLAEHHGKPRARALRPAELATYGNDAVIVVNPARALKRLAGVELGAGGERPRVDLPHHPHLIPQLELTVRDAIEQSDMSDVERQTLEAIAGILQQARRSPGVSIEACTIIVLASKRQRRRA